MLPTAILSGGLATRLHPVTKTLPKALIKISGQPFIFHQLKFLRKQGIRKVVICIGHLGEMIKSCVGDGSKFDLEILYSSEEEKLLGTGGAIKKALPKLGENFFVLYGDTFLPINFNLVEKAYMASDKLCMMTILKNDGKWDQSNVLFKKNKLIEYNKRKPTIEMKYIDYGLSILSADIFKTYLNKSIFDLSDLYESLSVQNKIEGYQVYERFYEIGTHNAIKETEKYFSNIK
mgnify:CR=1 FL=1